MVPLTGDALSYQFVQLGQDGGEQNVADNSVPYLSVAVCALAVAGVAAQMTGRAERSRGVAELEVAGCTVRPALSSFAIMSCNSASVQ